jgi:uncharacterized coiled-coil protein SlyX
MADVEERIKQLEEELAKSKQTCQELEKSSHKHPIIISNKDKTKYTGTGNVEEWIQHIQPFVQQRFSSEPEKVDYIIDHLDRRVRIELRLRIRTDKASAEEVFTILKEIYGIKESLLQLQQKCFGRNQGKDESLDDYSYALMELMITIQEMEPQLFKDPDPALKGKFVEGVNDTPLIRELKRLNLERKTLKFWELRDRAKLWLQDEDKQQTQKPKTANEREATTSETNNTTATSETISSSQMWKMMEEQKKQIEQLSQSVANFAKQGSMEPNQGHYYRPNYRRYQDNRDNRDRMRQHPIEPGYRQFQSQRQQSNEPFLCHYCKQPNHFARDCIKKKKDMEKKQRPNQCTPQFGTSAKGPN